MATDSKKVSTEEIDGKSIIFECETAVTVFFSHPESSYAIFCFNQKGDLFLNSDWGAYMYSWRSFGSSFSKFLMDLQPEYMVQKFENTHANNGGKRLPKIRVEHVTVLCKTFIEYLKLEFAKINNGQ